jgi:hypothetical protein
MPNENTSPNTPAEAVEKRLDLGTIVASVVGGGVGSGVGTYVAAKVAANHQGSAPPPSGKE